MGRFSVTLLANGYFLIRDRRSNLTGLYEADGSRRHGGLTLAQHDAAELIGRDYVITR
jgi:hypothetical protein